jgi:hypothetical protein
LSNFSGSVDSVAKPPDDDPFLVAWKQHFTYQAAKKFVAYPLFPLRDLKRDARAVLRGLIKFLHDYGWWPTERELAMEMEADLAGVVHICQTLKVMELIERRIFIAKGGGQKKSLAATALGWAALGLKPIEPWIRRPMRLTDRIAHRITINLADLASAQQAMEKRDLQVRNRRAKSPRLYPRPD